ncbi:MAG: hypothetical protein BRD57_03335 [Proteobacteria bacterium SW_6_67_9]|nr:MAG: hypothetical protein BRD57_03335 [Proteobacteria bacterium SW_6_67_9]
MIRWALMGAAASGLLAVALGAFGAHGLEDRLGDRAGVYDTALRYHFVHTLALAVGALAPIAGAGQRACRFACGLWGLRPGADRCRRRWRRRAIRWHSAHAGLVLPARCRLARPRRDTVARRLAGPDGVESPAWRRQWISRGREAAKRAKR